MPPAKNTLSESMDKVASIILAGGQGTRLYPLTQVRCKPYICFGGGYRLIDVPISNSLNAHIHRIFVISQYFASSLHQHILETYRLDHFRQSKIQMLCPEETPHRKLWFKGTADAIRQNKEHLASAPVDYFLILSGDQLYNINFVEMLNFAKTQDTDLVIAALPVEEKEATRMGLLKTNADHKVEDFFEKPSDPHILKHYALPPEKLKDHPLRHPKQTHYLASMGIYVFKRQALFDLVEEEGDDFGKDLIPIEVKRGKTVSYVYKGYWEDIGTITSYYEANMALIHQKNCLNTYDESNPIFTHPHNLPSPLIKDTLVTSSIIAQGSIIQAKEITNSVIGIRVKIDRDSVIRNSILLGTGFDDAPSVSTTYSVGKNCLLDKVILDEYSSIGNHVELTNKKQLKKFDGDGIFIRDGIIIVTSGTKVPDGFVL
jgi:glucose-1-phosphate adenylyltransferase